MNLFYSRILVELTIRLGYDINSRYQTNYPRTRLFNILLFLKLNIFKIF